MMTGNGVPATIAANARPASASAAGVWITRPPTRMTAAQDERDDGRSQALHGAVDNRDVPVLDVHRAHGAEDDERRSTKRLPEVIAPRTP